MQHTYFCCLLHVQPLAVVLQQEFVAPGEASDGDAVDGAGPVDAHAACGLCQAALDSSAPAVLTAVQQCTRTVK